MPALPVILQPEKLATPLVAASVLPPVQARVPPGLVPSPRVIELVAVVTVLPPTSWSVTPGWVVQATPLAPPPGWGPKTIWEAPPTVMEKELVSTVVKPLAAADSV